MTGFFTTLDDLIARRPARMVVLYSGGVDGSYLLQQLRDIGTRVFAVNVQIGDAEPPERARRQAAAYGATFLDIDATDEFFDEFVPAAIHADAMFQDLFPVSSTLTRPLMARVAVRVAREHDCEVVGHTATYMQNSALRLTASVVALAPELIVAAPFLGSDVARTQKLAALRADGFEFAEGIHSIDANPWARVIECGSLEDPENMLDESVFRWTSDTANAPEDGVELDIGFSEGLPVTIDNQAIRLGEIVATLNRLGGRHAVGRSSGLEDTAFTVKNHEVREAPAATVIIKAHQVLANAVLTRHEHSVRASIAREWTAGAVAGDWFGMLGESLARCLVDLDRPLTGVVRLRLCKGSITVLRVASAYGLYYSKLGQSFHNQMQAYAYEPWLSLRTLPERTRRAEDAS